MSAPSALAPAAQRPGPPDGGLVVADRFQLKERLGRGSGAEVFRAVDLSGGPDVAVKVALDRSERQHERIRNEASVLAGLRHPSIVRFVQQGVEPGTGPLGGRPFLVEELALGTSLSEAARSGMASPGVAGRWAAGLFAALEHVHSRGLVHRDIKPANIMLSGLRRSPVRIIDFGIAAVAGTAPELGVSSGTVHYMSPEQAAGGVAAPSGDVYSAGLVLLELLTGSKAFPGTAIEALVARTLRSPDVPGFLGPRWSPFLRSLTAMDSAERPSAGEAAAVAARLIPPAPAAPLETRACPLNTAFRKRRSRQGI